MQTTVYNELNILTSSLFNFYLYYIFPPSFFFQITRVISNLLFQDGVQYVHKTKNFAAVSVHISCFKPQ